VTQRHSIATRPRRDARAAGESIVAAFMREALPKASDATRSLAGELITATLSEVGKSFSEQARSEAAIAAYADAMADMFCAYLTRLARR
jgi:adenylylsulfate kinase-like enzyme